MQHIIGSEKPGKSLIGVKCPLWSQSVSSSSFIGTLTPRKKEGFN
jgi:hypothetical protein